MVDNNTLTAIRAAIEKLDKPADDIFAQYARQAYLTSANSSRIMAMHAQARDNLAYYRNEGYCADGHQSTASVTRYKHTTLNAWIRNLIEASGDHLLSVQPTVRPELQEHDLATIAKKVHDKINEMDKRGEINDLSDLTDTLKEAARAEVVVEITKEAEKKASAMQTLINDQLEEGDFQKVFMRFLSNVLLYPVAVMIAPLVERKRVPVWEHNNLVIKERDVVKFRIPDIQDYYPDPEGKRVGKGQYDIFRFPITRKYLLNALSIKGGKWIQPAIKDVLRRWDTVSKYNRERPFFQEFTPVLGDVETDPPVDLSIVHKGFNTETRGIDIGTDTPTESNVFHEETQAWGLRLYASVEGSVINQHMKGAGVRKSVDDDTFYEVEAIVCGDRTISFSLTDTSYYHRPVFGTSYIKDADSFVGFGMGEIIRPFEDKMNEIIRTSYHNFRLSADPSGEYDARRLLNGQPQGATQMSAPTLKAGVIVPVALNPFNGGGEGRAIRLDNIPNYSGQGMNLYNFLMQQIDLHTGCPSQIAGMGQGGGANRTVRGIIQLRNNALMTVQSGMVNIDNDVLTPLGENLFYYNMQTSDDDSVKGDCKVVSRGLGGILQSEIDKQSDLDSIQLAAPLLQAGMLTEGQKQLLVRRFLIALGLPEEMLNAEDAENILMNSGAPAAGGFANSPMPSGGADAVNASGAPQGGQQGSPRSPMGSPQSENAPMPPLQGESQ